MIGDAIVVTVVGTYNNGLITHLTSLWCIHMYVAIIIEMITLKVTH